MNHPVKVLGYHEQEQLRRWATARFHVARDSGLDELVAQAYRGVLRRSPPARPGLAGRAQQVEYLEVVAFLAQIWVNLLNRRRDTGLHELAVGRTP